MQKKHIFNDSHHKFIILNFKMAASWKNIILSTETNQITCYLLFKENWCFISESSKYHKMIDICTCLDITYTYIAFKEGYFFRKTDVQSRTRTLLANIQKN